jgi:hypothetical protein
VRIQVGVLLVDLPRLEVEYPEWAHMPAAEGE